MLLSVEFLFFTQLHSVRLLLLITVLFSIFSPLISDWSNCSPLLLSPACTGLTMPSSHMTHARFGPGLMKANGSGCASWARQHAHGPGVLNVNGRQKLRLNASPNEDKDRTKARRLRFPLFLSSPWTQRASLMPDFGARGVNLVNRELFSRCVHNDLHVVVVLYFTSASGMQCF